MKNKMYKDKLKYLRENPDKIKDYAGYIHNGMFRKCRKCNGKGIITPILDNGHSINIFCSCVHKNIRKEVEELENGTDIS